MYKTLIALILGSAILAGTLAHTNKCRDVAAIQSDTIVTVEGKFYGPFEETLYQFKSHDDSVWWLLSADEIGYVPDITKEYALTYDNNGTTAANKPCDCIPEWECECEVYDDEFISIKIADR